MKRQGILSEETLEYFKEISIYFGELWRKHLQQQATPKLHLLEVHVIQDLQRLNRGLGLFAEDPIERQHKDQHQYDRLLTNIRSWKQKQHAIKSRRHADKNPEIAGTMAMIKANETRKFKPDTEMKRKQKEDDRKVQMKTAEETLYQKIKSKRQKI